MRKSSEQHAKQTIHLISGDKGGTGKSAFASLMVDYYASKGISIKPIDGDITNPTLSLCHSDAIGVLVSDDRDLFDQLNIIFLTAHENKQTVIVDLPARSEHLLSEWLTAANIITLSKENQIELVKWWVSDGEPSTIEMFASSMKKTADIPHVFVKNMGLAKPFQWLALDSHSEIQDWLKSGKVRIIEFPWINKNLILKARQLERSFAQLSQPGEPSVNIMERGGFQGFLNQGFKVLDLVNALDISVDTNAEAQSNAAA